jgi:hypothetical protein
MEKCKRYGILNERKGRFITVDLLALTSYFNIGLAWGAQQSVTKSIAMIVLNLVTPEVVAKHDLLFNKLPSQNSLYNRSSC